MKMGNRLTPHVAEGRKDFLSLQFLDRLQPVFESFGVDYPVMRRILRVKLVMDGRRVPTVMSNRQGGDENSRSNRSSLLLYGFLGLFIGLMVILPMPMFLKMNIVLGMLLFMIMTTMISDFSSVLLDLRDKNILLTLPVSARTLNAAKLVHIIIYLTEITAALAAASLAAGLIRYGIWFFLLLLFELILVCGFVLLFTSILYFVILRFFSGERLKDIINYFQIILSVCMTLGYQLVGRLFDFSSGSGHFSPQWWNFLLPSAWFAAPFSLLVDHDYSTIYLLLTAAGIVIPILAVILYFKAVAPAFEKNLQKLAGGSERGHTVKKHSVQRAISRLLCPGRLEKAFFVFSSDILKNERKLKLRLYPNIAFAVIFPFIFLLNRGNGSQSFAQILAQTKSGDSFLFLYLSAMMLSPMLTVLAMSENYKGAWIYRVMPVASPEAILRGTFTAFVYKYVFPVFFFSGLVFALIYGPQIIPDLILIFLNTLLLMLLVFKYSDKELPFCRDFQSTQNNNITVVILSLVLCGVFAGVHYLLRRFFSPGIFLFLAVSIVFSMILWRTAFHVTWQDLTEND